MAEQYRCPSCPKTFKSKGALTTHIRREHDELTELRARWGEQAPLPGGAWLSERPLRAAPTGIPSIDYMTGIGGLPQGSMVEVYGEASSGKTMFALMVSAYAQRHGGRAGLVDAEKRFQASMALAVPDLDLAALEICRPKIGDSALQITKEFVETGRFAVWTVDSVHACTPQKMLEARIGDKNTMMALAQLMSAACQAFDKIVPETDTVLIFTNHVKSAPANFGYGKDWSKPGGTALDYYASMQLRMSRTYQFHDADGRLLGQTVKVRVDNSKVAAPHSSATYDLFLAPGKIKKAGHERNGQIVFPGVDLGASWLAVAEEAKLILEGDKGYVDAQSGEFYGAKRETSEMLADDCELRRRLEEHVYGAYARPQEDVA